MDTLIPASYRHPRSGRLKSVLTGQFAARRASTLTLTWTSFLTIPGGAGHTGLSLRLSRANQIQTRRAAPCTTPPDRARPRGLNTSMNGQLRDRPPEMHSRCPGRQGRVVASWAHRCSSAHQHAQRAQRRQETLPGPLVALQCPPNRASVSDSPASGVRRCASAPVRRTPSGTSPLCQDALPLPQLGEPPRRTRPGGRRASYRGLHGHCFVAHRRARTRDGDERGSRQRRSPEWSCGIVPYAVPAQAPASGPLQPASISLRVDVVRGCDARRADEAVRDAQNCRCPGRPHLHGRDHQSTGCAKWGIGVWPRSPFAAAPPL